MGDVIKKNTKTLSLKNPTSSSLTKIIKDKLDVDINNIKGSDIPRLFKQGLKFKGMLGKRIIDGISSFIKKNPNTKKQYEKFLPDSLKKNIKKDKKIVKTPTNVTPKKIKKIDISNIMKNPRTGRGQNLPTRVTDKNKNTGTNLTKRVIEGEVLQGVKKNKNVGNVNRGQTIDGKFQNITPKSNRISNIRTPNLNVKGIRPKAVVDALDDFPKFKPKEAPANEIKKVKPSKDFTPKIKTPKTPKVIKKELPKVKTPIKVKKKSRSNIKGSSSYDAQFTYDNLKKRGLNPKGRMSPENYAKVKKLKEGTKDKTIGKPMSPKDALNKKFKEKATMYKNIMGMTNKKPTRKRTMVEKIFGGGPDEAYNLKKGQIAQGANKQARKEMKKEYPTLMKRITKKSAGKTVGLKPLPPKSESPGIHKLPAKAKMNMGFKPMFGGGFISSLYDKPEKTEKHKGNTTSARQVKGYGKAKRP